MSGDDFGAPGDFFTELLSKYSPFLLLFPFQVRLMLLGFCQRRPEILKMHCFGLVTGDKCHDITDHFSYTGSGCHIKSFSLLACLFAVSLSGMASHVLIDQSLDITCD